MPPESSTNLSIRKAEKTDIRFLLQAIDLTNDCDLKYKTSKNQRLLVELTLMKIASITFDGQKKKSKHFIIPASHFISTIVEEKLDVPENKIPKIIKDKEKKLVEFYKKILKND